MPYLPVSNPKDVFSTRLDVYSLFAQHEFNTVKYSAKLPTGRVLKGVLDKHGRTDQLYADANERIDILVGQSLEEWGMVVDPIPNEDQDMDSDQA